MTDFKLTGFDLIEKIGEGGMGQVWKARQLSLDRLVAIKLLPPLLNQDPESVRQLIREARTTAKIKHSGIIHVYDVSEQDGHCCLVMEFVDGYTISQWLTRKKVISCKDALAVVESVAVALKYAWSEAGLIHCDIKPENIMVDRDGTVKVADLGLSITHDSRNSGLGADEVAGTPGYISPEQALGDLPLDCRTDIYALGCCLYHMVTGVRPFKTLPDREAMEAQISKQIPDPREIVPVVSAPVCALIEWMLVKNREHRPKDWDEVLTELNRIQNNVMAIRAVPPEGASTMRRRRPIVDSVPKSQDLSLMQVAPVHNNKPEQSNLDKMKVSLSEQKNRSTGPFGKEIISAPTDGVRSPREFFPAGMRGQKVRRKSSLVARIMRFSGAVVLVMIVLGVFCYFDFSKYRSWIHATEVLPDLRKSASNEKRAEELRQLATVVSPDNVDLKSGLLGILAIRRVGMGDQAGGLYSCKQVCRQFPSSWFASHFSEEALYSSCDACVAQGTSLIACPFCKGSMKCMRCGGSGAGSFSAGDSRPAGTGGGIRNTGKIYGIGDTCLDCRGSKKCQKCGGTGKIRGSCAKCAGQGRQFSQQKVIDLYRASIDSVMELQKPWIKQIVRLQSRVKSWLPFF